MKLMVVESPKKVTKIAEALGDGWQVIASYGHIRDLPRNSFGMSKPDFDLEYEYIPAQKSPTGGTFPGSAERVARIRKLVPAAEVVYLATDPDREGEAIAWHLKDALGLDEHEYQRVTFGEITPKAILAAVAQPRKIDDARVRAQEGRRALDRIVGYLVSPALSDALGLNLSAGRVQSVAVRLVVDLERRIKAFKATNHFGAVVTFDGGAWSAQWDTTPFISDDKPYVLDEALAARAAACRSFRVVDAESKETSERPPSPFSTSLMLRAASVKLKMSVERATKAAQKLFEGEQGSKVGHVTYIRTDSVNLSETGIAEIRDLAASAGWELPDKPRKFKEKASAQEGHEAIRPTHIEVEDAGGDDDQRALYRLIRERAIASQLADARYRVNTVRLVATDSDRPFEYVARGKVMLSPGWRALTDGDAADEGTAGEGEAETGKVPVLAIDSAKQAQSGELLRKKTEPPRRFSEAGLVEKLENEGIGRPATYPAIMKTIIQRGYVAEEKRLLVPTSIGELLVDSLVAAEFGFIELDFTRELEVELDAIAEGKATYRDVVARAYQRINTELVNVLRSGKLAPRYKCPKCGGGLRRHAPADKTPFWRCQGDTCGHYMDDNKGEPVERQTHPCPKCKTAMRRFKRRSSGGHVWACPAEGCGNFSDDLNGKPLPAHACPKCTSPLRRYQKKDKETGKPKGGHGWFCTGDGCGTFMDDDKGKPVAIKTAPCPKCGKAMFRRKGQYGFWWGCSGYKDGCKTMMDDKDGKPVPKQARTPSSAKPRAGGPVRLVLKAPAAKPKKPS